MACDILFGERTPRSTCCIAALEQDLHREVGDDTPGAGGLGRPRPVDHADLQAGARHPVELGELAAEHLAAQVVRAAEHQEPQARLGEEAGDGRVVAVSGRASTCSASARSIVNRALSRSPAAAPAEEC
ncbi:hypothetical protein [Glycomyces sp. NPDC048151]|uniref:hypothetical protein n=1 Tax=Glycomyces sp. NPDC048151 TaxID=3364002 RepID=UPI00371C02F4